MKLQATIELMRPAGKLLAGDSICVDIDCDYVTADAEDVNEWVRNELEAKFNRPFWDEDFNITNLDDVLEELAFDEFIDKVG